MGLSVKEMQEKANEILKSNNVTGLPIDIISILQKDGFKVYKMNLTQGMTGALLVDERKNISNTGVGKLIVVENDANAERGRFISAHEYGHYHLQKDDNLLQFAHRDYAHSDEPIELEADLFARSILMPYDFIKEELNKVAPKTFKEEDVISFISKRCNVTFKKATKRFFELKEEGILDFDEEGFLKVG